MRQAMHPADQFEAFKTLIDSAHGIEDVAARFGVTPTVACRRLKQRPRDPTAAHGGAEGAAAEVGFKVANVVATAKAS